MKITNAEVIQSGERDLIDAITADLDWAAIEEIILKEHNLEIEEDIEYKSGDIVARNNQIAYQLEFEIKAHLSILLDRNGDYLSVAISGDKSRAKIEDGENSSDNEDLKSDGYKEAFMDLDESGDMQTEKLESQVGEMLEEISEERLPSADNA